MGYPSQQKQFPLFAQLSAKKFLISRFPMDDPDARDSEYSRSYRVSRGNRIE